MAVIETWLHQDLQEPVKVNHLDGNLFSNNGNGNRIGVVLTNNGEALASISGTVSGYVVTADGSTVPCTGSKSGNRASILIPAAAYQPGSILITVFVTDGTTVTTIGAVCTTVMRSRTNAQVDPGSTVTDWTQTINAAMQSVETAAANLGGIVAVPYASITFPVPLGKYTYNNNNLYRCITPIASSESFTAAHWIQVRLGNDVSDLKSALTQSLIQKSIDGWESGVFTPSGSNYASASYIRNQNKIGVSDGVSFVTVSDVYEMRVFAWDGSDCIGTLKTDGTFDTVAGNFAYVNEFYISKYPNYTFKFAIRRVSQSTDITTNEGTNVKFHYYTDKTLKLAGKVADAKSVGDGLDELETAFCGIGEAVDCNSGWTTNGAYYSLGSTIDTIDINNPAGSNNNYTGMALPCSPGDIFLFTSKGSSGARSYGLLTSASGEGNVYGRASSDDSQSGFANYRLEIPQGISYVVFNSNKNVPHYVYKLDKNIEMLKKAVTTDGAAWD